jgi:hypothetical protein
LARQNRHRLRHPRRAVARRGSDETKDFVREVQLKQRSGYDDPHQGHFRPTSSGQHGEWIMTALVQAAATLSTRQGSDFGIVAIFGLTLSLVAAHVGFGAS